MQRIKIRKAQGREKDSPAQIPPWYSFRIFTGSMSPSLMFILFFGTRPGKRREAPLPRALCPYCGQTGTLKAVLIPNYIHLFWIPVYRLRHMASVECSHCKKAYEGREMTPEMERAIEQLKPT